MLFCIFRLDREDSAPARERLRAAHLQHLRQHGDAILFAGPLRHAGDQGEAGSLYLVDFASLESAMAFARDDPFTQADLFTVTEVRHFAPTFGPCAAALRQWPDERRAGAA